MTLEVFGSICASNPYQPKGMFYSEVFLFLQACQTHGVDLIIESGVKNGMSTRLMAAASYCEIISIDRNPVSFDAVFPSVQLLKGDSFQLLPRLLAQYSGRRIGVLIDGPKGAAALGLKDVCLAALNCRVVGVHDTQVNDDDAAAKGIVHSHSWYSRFSYVRQVLDRHVPESWRQKYPLGPGLGLWEKML